MIDLKLLKRKVLVYGIAGGVVLLLILGLIKLIEIIF
jgi:hypothetical protein